MKRRIIASIVGLGLIGGSVLGVVGWFTFRVYVPPDKCAVLIRKMGRPLPPGQRVATEPGQKGIQEQVLGPGRYFYNPIVWEWELKDLTVIPSGDPGTWKWARKPQTRRRDAGAAPIQAGRHEFSGEYPQIGVVTRKIGKKRDAAGQVIVKRDSGYEGIWEEVLTPGVYKLNTYVYEVDLYPAAVIPAGFVGVVTNLFGKQAESAQTGQVSTGPAGTQPADGPQEYVRALAKPGQRGTLSDVLQPGVYFINPKLQKVQLIEIGYNEYSQLKISEAENLRIAFPSDTGFLIKVGVTVVWGIHPTHAAQIINEFGQVDEVLDKVIGPQLRSICRNTGSKYTARDFIEGEKRELFQQEMTAELQRVCQKKNIDVLLALVREIEVHAPGAGPQEGEVTEDLKRTIQQSYIAIENQLTKEKQRDAAMTKAELEQVRKEIDIARETIVAETRVLVANIDAEGEKKAAETDAQAQLEVASIQQEVARLDAKQIEILGQARADVEKMKGAAEAEGYKLLVDAFGSPRAYNLYTFAEGFKPESIRLFFAGEGTFWTDLSRFEEVGAAKLLGGSAEKSSPMPKMPPKPAP